MSILQTRNEALDVNPPTGSDIHITVRGSDWYWTVCAVMTLSALAFAGLSTRKPRNQRIFHYITAIICLAAAIAYFTMAADLGWVPVQVEFMRDDHRVAGSTRQVFYARYIDWFITTPLLLLDLLLTASMPWPTILFVIVLDEVMVVTGLVGALVVSRYKWGYFVFGCAAMAYVIYVLAFQARRSAAVAGVGRVYNMCGALTAFIWFFYPIAWGLCEGGNVIAPDSEAVFYGILDLIAKPVFGALLIWGHRNVDVATLGLNIRDGTAHHGEKHHNTTTGTGIGAGTGSAPVRDGPLTTNTANTTTV